MSARDLAPSCDEHKRGRRLPKDVGEMERLMKDLPDYQGGEGRHKCPYCAYVEGFNEGLRLGCLGNGSGDGEP